MKEILREIKNLERKIVIIFLSVAILQTISWYFGSRLFFRNHLSIYFTQENLLFFYEFYYWFVADFVLLFIIPLSLIIFFFKENLKEYGLKSGDYKTGSKYSAYSIIVIVPLIWLATSTFDSYPTILKFVKGYPVYVYFFGLFFYMIAWEFFWRGYMLFGLFKKFGYYALFIQMIPFVILHNGKPFIETFGAIAGGLILGMIALRTKSILYPVIIHFFIIVFTETLYYIRFETGEFGIGITSFINIILKLF